MTLGHCSRTVRPGRMPRRPRRAHNAYEPGDFAAWLPSILQVLPEHRLRGIDPAIDDGSQQAFVRSYRFRERWVSALPLHRSASRVDEREVPAGRVLEPEHLVRPVGITRLTEHVHQSDRPLPPLWIDD